MSNKIAITTLLLFILLCSAVIAPALIINLPESSHARSLIRAKLVQYPALRNIYHLHDAGDARSDYLSSRTKRIAILRKEYVDPWFNETVFNAFAEEVTEVTGKETVFVETIPTESDTATLTIYLETKNEEDPKTLGKTLNENSIILYRTGLEYFTESIPETKELYVTSTLLHEFGHQLGLDHNETPGCLMNSSAESDHIPKHNAKEVVTAFCKEELDGLEIIKNSL